MRVEVAGPNRFWIWQETRPVLLAKVARWRYGVHYLWLPGYLPVLPPITAALARTAPAWPHRYASWLTAAPGPLHAGWWSLRPWRPPGPESVWRNELALDPVGYLDWCAGWNGIVPMRLLPSTDQARVKAYRKLAREGVLPPLLLWWVSGLDGWLLLDGHARLAAALAEGLLPPMLELSLAPSPAQIDEQIAHVTRKDSLIADQLEHDRQAGRPAVTVLPEHISGISAPCTPPYPATLSAPGPGPCAAVRLPGRRPPRLRHRLTGRQIRRLRGPPAVTNCDSPSSASPAAFEAAVSLGSRHRQSAITCRITGLRTLGVLPVSDRTRP